MVIKEANDFMSFTFGDIQFLDIMNFAGRATFLGFFLKTHKASETKCFFLYERFDSVDELENEDSLSYKAFFSKLGINNSLDKDFTGYRKLRSSGLDEQQASKKPAYGWENYKCLQEIWQKHGMTTLKYFAVVQQQKCCSNH